MGLTTFAVHAFPLRILSIPKQADGIELFFSDSLLAALSRAMLHKA